MLKLATWAALILYLGVGIIIGAMIMTLRDFDVAMAVGGGIVLICAGIFAFCQWRILKAKKAVGTTKGSEEP